MTIFYSLSRNLMLVLYFKYVSLINKKESLLQYTAYFNYESNWILPTVKETAQASGYIIHLAIVAIRYVET
jgi:hypothetical protein